MNDLPENDALWNLLGRAHKTDPSPFFARNVLRTVRHLNPQSAVPTSLFRWMNAAAFAILLIGFSITLIQSTHKTAVPKDLVEYFDLAAGLDQLTFVEDVTPANFIHNSL
jgi:hypothetical protein